MRYLSCTLTGWTVSDPIRSSCRRNEAAFGCEAVVKPDIEVGQVKPGLRIYGRFATGRSLVPTAAATGFEPQRKVINP